MELQQHSLFLFHFSNNVLGILLQRYKKGPAEHTPSVLSYTLLNMTWIATGIHGNNVNLDAFVLAYGF